MHKRFSVQNFLNFCLFTGFVKSRRSAGIRTISFGNSITSVRGGTDVRGLGVGFIEFFLKKGMHDENICVESL